VSVICELDKEAFMYECGRRIADVTACHLWCEGFDR